MKRGFKKSGFNKKGLVRKLVENNNNFLNNEINKNIMNENNKDKELIMHKRRKVRLGIYREVNVVGGDYNRNDVRVGLNVEKPAKLYDLSLNYQKKDIVDYDIVICIPSYNRYEKVKKLIKQFYSQPTEYSFKLILLNDGSNEEQYDDLINHFPNIIYVKNETPNGKIKHWYCYNQMWENIKNIECHAVLQMDDDFILCENFLNTIVKMFFEKKENDNKILAIAPHLYSNKFICESEPWWSKNDTFIDGIALFDIEVIKFMKYKMNPVNVNRVKREGNSAMAWAQLDVAMKSMGGHVFRTENSLVFHNDDGNSKLHPNHRKFATGRIYTQKFIGNID